MITIANKYHGASGINIMRGSVLGNPYEIDKNNRREQVVAKYYGWLRDQYASRADVYNELMDLAKRHNASEDIVLVCCCAPKLCHGDIIKKAIESIAAQLDCWVSKP